MKGLVPATVGPGKGSGSLVTTPDMESIVVLMRQLSLPEVLAGLLDL